MIQRIQLRRGTAAQWTAADPTLAAGEAGFETDTGKLKIGDGTTAWTSLLYVTDCSEAPVAPAYATQETSAGTLHAHRIVKYDANGKLEVVDPTALAHVNTAIGMSLQAGTTDSYVNVARFGRITDSSFAFTPGARLYIGADGVPVESLPVGAVFMQAVGRARTATEIYLGIEPAILLA